MNKTTKILASAFGVIILFAFVSKFVYPSVRPWFALDEEIAKKEEELAALTDLRDRVGKAREDYRGWVERTGSFEVGQVMTDVRDRLNQLIEKHGLEEAKVSPNRAAPDRKTGKTVTGVTVTATGNLASAVGFLKDVSELPHLIRVMNPSFSPATSARRGLPEDRLNIKVPIELWVLPQHKVVERIDPATLVRPEFYVRHQGRDYSPIWTGQPFTDYVELQAQANPSSVQVQVGQHAALNVSASGGHGSYKYEWAPPEGLADPASPNPKVDTAEPGNKRYTVTVTDASGHKAQATVMVNVSKPPEVVQQPDQVVQRQPPPPPPLRGPQPWPDAGSWEIRMALLQTKGPEREDELMLFNTANQTKKYVTIGDDLNGGKLLYVHQRGAVGQRGDQYFIYPLGMPVSSEIPADSAQEFPELQRAVIFHRDAVAELSRKKAADAEAAKAPGLLVPGDGAGATHPGAPQPAAADNEAPIGPIGADGDPRLQNVSGLEGPPLPTANDGVEGIPGPVAGDAGKGLPADGANAQGPAAPAAANADTQGPPPDAADVTAAPGNTAGTRSDAPPADAAGSERKAEEGATGAPKQPATKRRPVRNRRPK